MCKLPVENGKMFDLMRWNIPIMLNPDFANDFKEILLERIQLRIEQRTSMEYIKLNVLPFFDCIASQMVFALEASIWGEKAGIAEIRFPKDWWQALKARFAPKWFLRKWPVLEAVHKVDFFRVYSKLPISLLGEENVVIVRSIQKDLSYSIQ